MRIPPALAGVALAVAAFLLHAQTLHFVQDDAYISLRYAGNLVDGHGLVFNPGERVEGYSNFTWTILLALLLEWGLPALAVATRLGIVLGAATILIACRLTRSLEGHWGPATVATGWLLAASGAFALWSSGGLETALFTFLVTLGLERGLAPDVGARGRAFAAFLFGFASLTRPDGPLVFGIWFAIRTFDTLRGGPVAALGRRALLGELALFVLPLVPYAGWKLAWFGDLLPNTYYAKAGTSLDYLRRGLAYLLDFTRAYALAGIVPALALVSLARGALRSVEARLLTVWIGWAVYVVAIGGDVLHIHRFWVPLLPTGTVLLARGITRSAEAVSRGRGDLAWALAIAAVALIGGAGYQMNRETIRERRNLENLFVLNMEKTGTWLGANLPPDATIATTTVGAISWTSGLRVIDMLGLTDREVARQPLMIDGLTDEWREVKYNAESVLRRSPDAILFSTGIRPSAAAEKALFLYEAFHRDYYAHYFRSEPERNNVQIAFLRRERADRTGDLGTRFEGIDFLDEYSAGLLAANDGDMAEALRRFERAAELGPPGFVAPREWRGYLLQSEQGLDILRGVIEQDDHAVLAHLRLGESAIDTGDLDAAERVLRHLTEFDPDEARAWFGLAEVARRRRDWGQAYELATEASNRWAYNSSYLVLLGDLATRLDLLDEAETHYRGALALSPSLESARRGLETVQRVRVAEQRAKGRGK